MMQVLTSVVFVLSFKLSFSGLPHMYLTAMNYSKHNSVFVSIFHSKSKQVIQTANKDSESPRGSLRYARFHGDTKSVPVLDQFHKFAC